MTDAELFPNNNWDLMENNEVGANAHGGTERYSRFVFDGTIPRALFENVQIIPSRIREIKEDKIRVYWEHNLPNDPESIHLKEENLRNRFHKIVFLSNWHYQQFMNHLGMPYESKNTVIEGGFYIDETLPPPEKPDPKEMVNIAYYTTPHRGLEILVPVFVHMAKEDPKIHLHVHSSFKMYGWDDRDKQFEQLYKTCEEHPQITYHGFTEYWELRKQLEKYHIFGYPNIWPETMCRSVLEGMYYGLVCVHPNFAALPDTTGGLNPFMYSATTNHNEHANIFLNQLHNAVQVVRESPEGLKNQLLFNRAYICTRYSSRIVHYKWEKLLEALNQQYPTVESRAMVKEQFIYRVN
jgi:glycosyltransferase involved in cell wall biosynthesis